MPPDKLVVRAALRLRDVFLARAVQSVEQVLLDRLTGYQRALEQTRAALHRVAAESWPIAVPQVRRSLLSLQKAVRDAVDQTSQQFQKPGPPVPDLRSLVEELLQLGDEFGGLQVDCQKKILRVTTETIELEGIELGPFAIQLSWPALAREAASSCFEIVALDPNPAATNEAVTHPHVHAGVLCAGDAKVPIQRALEQGRLADAFCLVRSVLTHYNPNSPHVPLDEWGGHDCYECGASVSADDLSYCERCGYDYCQDCISSCVVCDDTRCHECLQRCPLCEEWICSGCLVRSAPSCKVCCRRCLRSCAACGAELPSDELDPQTERCPSCLSEVESPDEPDSAASSVPAPEHSPTENHHELATPAAAIS